MKKVIMLFMLVSIIVLGAEEFKIEETTRKEEPFGYVIKNPKDEVIKEFRYQEFDGNGNPTRMDIIERDKKRAKKVGDITITYNKGKRLFSVEKNIDGDVVEISYFYDRDGEEIEEIRDGQGNFKKFLKHQDKTMLDVTSDLIEERWINKLVVNEDEMLQVLKPLDSLQMILEKDERMVLSNALINFSSAKSTTDDTLVAQLITDAIREYVDSDLVIYNGGNLDGRIRIGVVRYENIKSIIKDEKLYLFRVWGETLQEIFENARKLPSKHREFPNTAGLTWDTTLDDVYIEIAGNAIDKFKKYSVVVNEYIKEGNGIYYPFKDLKAFEIRHPASIITAEYLRKISVIDRSYIVEDRYITKK